MVRVARRYTSAGGSPYEGVRFQIVGNGPPIETPASWSNGARAMLVHRLLLRTEIAKRLRKVPEDDVPAWLWRRGPDPGSAARIVRDGRGGEASARDAFDRLAGVWTYWGWRGGYFDSQSDARTFHDEIKFMLCHGMARPDLTLWRGAGLHWAYGLETRAGALFAADYRTGRVAPADRIQASSFAPDTRAATVLDLTAFRHRRAAFDTEGFVHAVRLWTMALDITIQMAPSTTRGAAERAWAERPIGLEPANLNGLLAMADYRHDGAEAHALCAAIGALLTGTAWATSSLLAEALGAAPAGDSDGDEMTRDGERYHGIARAGAPVTDVPPPFRELRETAREIWECARAGGRRHGVRNARIAFAPTVTADNGEGARHGPFVVYDGGRTRNIMQQGHGI